MRAFRSSVVLVLAVLANALFACSGGDADTNPEGSGGSGAGSGNTTGGNSPGLGGQSTLGGANGTTGGNSNGGTTSASNGGMTGASNGGASAGATAAGGNGSGTGGATSAGGNSGNQGGATNGGANSGGNSAKGGTTGAGGTATGGKSTTGGTSAQGGRANTGGTASGGAASGGTTASGGAGTCTASWNPPATANGNTDLPAGLEAVWAHSGAVIQKASNLKIHQIMANKGTMSYCVRWDSTSKLSATQRDQIESLIGKCEKQWIDQLKDWGCWPYPSVAVKVTLWAVKDRALLDWPDGDTTAKVVVNSGATCPTDCGPWDPNNAHNNCSSAKYDEFFWLDGSVTTFTGWGSATGFMMGATSFINAAATNPNTYVILAHEMGHGHGLDDFYDWQPAGWKSWIMNSGSASSVTETDGWMLRDVWRHVRSKYGYPGP